jgi:ubiquinone/menaquinone biosynthesis C-methylase UbiE
VQLSQWRTHLDFCLAAIRAGLLGAWMLGKLVTTNVQSTADIREFFDRAACTYSEQHGHPERLLDYRIRLIKRYARPRNDEVLLDIGCGSGDHLLTLIDDIGRGIGVDLSPAMIQIAHARLQNSHPQAGITFISDDAERLASLAEGSIDLAICVGALEHMLNKSAVMISVHRVLKPGGRFFCLTLNGGYVWYQVLAPLLRFQTRHLSTDRFLRRNEALRLLADSGFSRLEVGCWTFIPKGDMPAILGVACHGLDFIGRALRVASLRGGLWASAWKAK